MSRQINIYVLLASLLWLLASGGDVYAASCSSVTTGNWNNSSTWNNCGGTYPHAGDAVTISNQDTVTVTANAAATSVTIASGDAGSGLTISGTYSLSVSGAVTINPSTQDNATKQINVGAGTLSAGSIAINSSSSDSSRVSSLSLSTGTINVSGDISFSGRASAARLVYTGAGTVNLTGNFDSGGPHGTLTTVTGSVLNFNGTAAQTAASYTTYNVVKVNNSAGLTMAGTSTIATLTIGDVTANSDFNDGGFQVTSAGTLNLVSGTFTLGSATSATTMPAFTTRNISAGTTIEYASGQPQTVAAITYANLMLSNNSTKTAAGNFLVSGNLAINAGTFADSTGVVTVNGNVYNAGTYTASTGSITLSGGSSAHVLSGSGTYANLVMNDTQGATITGSPTVNGKLTLTNGDISTGASIMEVSASCASGISGGGSNSYVVGNLRLHYPAGGTSCNFPIGDATNYTPAMVAMTGVTSTLVNSTLTARTDTPDHADTTAGTSGINGAKSVNRTWTLTPGGSLAFSTYSPTFTFVAGDIDSGAATANFIVARKNAGVWSYPAMGLKTGTTTQATGITQANGFGIFAIGEPSSLPLLTVTKTTSPVITSTNPGMVVTYTSVITNSGTGAAKTVVLTDILSPYTAWGVNSFGAGIAFQFVDGPGYGAAASGLTLGTAVYSNNNGGSWGYSPTSTGGGAPAGYDANVTNWKIPMTGTMTDGSSNPKPSFTINYKVIVR